MRFLILFFMFSTQLFASSKKDMAIEELNEYLKTEREYLISEIKSSELDDEQAQIKIEYFDAYANSAIEELESLSEEQVNCFYEPGYMFLFTKLALEDKDSWKNSTTTEKLLGVLVGVPIIIGIDIVTLPFTALFGFIGPKYCDN